MDHAGVFACFNVLIINDMCCKLFDYILCAVLVSGGGWGYFTHFLCVSKSNKMIKTS